ncbi:hypothetical protein HDU84_007162 [Entophlyctis sp. JEL0112]|nr:hypothetical protein HDU84_007162 [Entophlyctis sp. JEL0112]
MAETLASLLKLSAASAAADRHRRASLAPAAPLAAVAESSPRPPSPQPQFSQQLAVLSAQLDEPLHAAPMEAPPSPAPRGMTPEEFQRTQAARARELIVEHFGFDVTDFVDDVLNAVNTVIMQSLEAFEEFVVEQFGGDEEAAESVFCDPCLIFFNSVFKGIVAMQTLMESAIDKCFDRFEVYVRRFIFAIPPGLSVTLPHYENLDISQSNEDTAALDEEIASLRRRIAASTHFDQTVSAELSKIIATNENLGTLLNSFKSIAGASKTVAPMSKIAALQDDMATVEDNAAAVSQILSGAMESHGEIPYATRSAAEARALADYISAFKKRRTTADDTSGATADLRQSSKDSGGMQQFLRGIQAAGVASVAEMAEARDAGLVPEALSSVKWGY